MNLKERVFQTNHHRREEMKMKRFLIKEIDFLGRCTVLSYHWKNIYPTKFAKKRIILLG
jgi:hypothetical protein